MIEGGLIYKFNSFLRICIHDRALFLIIIIIIRQLPGSYNLSPISPQRNCLNDFDLCDNLSYLSVNMPLIQEDIALFVFTQCPFGLDDSRYGILHHWDASGSYF